MAKSNKGVTVVTSTFRQSLIQNVFHNYVRQAWRKKELIVVINKDDISINKYRDWARRFPNVTVYKLPEKKNLGSCLNYAVERAKYAHVAKFDDDDYYGPNYLTEAMNVFRRTNADVVGKHGFFFYFPHKSVLLQRKTWLKPNSRCRKVAGATIMLNKRIFGKVKFATNLRSGSDRRFLNDCVKKGCRIHTSSPYNFAAIRRENPYSHTWKVSEKTLFGGKNVAVFGTNDFRSYVNKPIKPVTGTRPTSAKPTGAKPSNIKLQLHPSPYLDLTQYGT
ncbi:glycosyltransferase family 2 protein [Paenibacillus arenilitoris]|uniref:Glycosyltransferase family 2 protein n=1 Tax=Paenibacillus arenilitoris TaxID=2772299 RepID=A0A927CIQ1_9BACL|nr:glycosyltransferase [Paenibacillus arenilitoris]MBD2867427.1 glycosyltransferase family 2 protein [Paenibacillus arenilitoris]